MNEAKVVPELEGISLIESGIVNKKNSTPRVVVQWKGISLHAQTPAGPKAILRGLTGHASPGELVAIMGPS